jgi:hypothetical protein
MKGEHWKTPNADATTAVVLQLFGEGIMGSMGHSTSLANMVTRDSTEVQTPGSST